MALSHLYGGAVEGEIESMNLRRLSLNCFILYSGSCTISMIRSGIMIEGVTDLSLMLGVTIPRTRPVIMFLLLNKGL